MHVWLVRSAAAAAVALWPLAPAVAAAEEPIDLDPGQITDQVDALAGRRGEVEDALDALFVDYRLNLYVVYVDDFAGMEPQMWAAETARRSDFGINDALLAVSTDDRVYALAIDPDYPLTDAQIAEVRQIAIEPPLGQNDWAGSAIGAADGFAAVLAAEQVETPEIIPGEQSPSAEDDFPWIPVAVLVGAGAVGGVGLAYLLSRRR